MEEMELKEAVTFAYGKHLSIYLKADEEVEGVDSVAVVKINMVDITNKKSPSSASQGSSTS